MFFKDYITVKNIIFVFLVILILKFISQIQAIAMLFFASYIIACSLNPIVDRLEKKMKRPLATSLVLMVTLIVFAAFFIPVIFVAVKQIQGLILILPAKLEAIQNFIFTHKFYGYKLPEIISLNTIIGSSSQFTTGIVNQSINITFAFAQGVMFFLAICMIVFYLLADKDVIKAGFIRFFPEKMKEKAQKISGTISRKVGGYVIAQILNMIVIGILTAIGLSLLRVDYALLLGIITGVLDIVPLVGPTIALILCLIMAYQSGPLGLLLVLIAFLVAQWISNNFVRPIVFGRFLDLHPLVIIFSLLVAAQFLGVWGVILAPALAAMICVLFDELYLQTVNKSK